MRRLTLVRHGQAAFKQADYDQLSAAGHAQGAALGRDWLARGRAVDQVIIGPRRRHAATAAAVAAVYGLHGQPWPAPELLAALDEHQAWEVMEAALPARGAADPAIAVLAEAARGDAPSAHRDALRLFKRLAREWARGELAPPGLECWADFWARVGAALQTLARSEHREIVAFTSGGTMAAAVGHILQLTPETVLNLNWQIHNAAVTELVWSERRWQLHSFNQTAHLAAAQLTFV